MSTDIIKQETFHQQYKTRTEIFMGMPVRIIEINGKFVIPLVDIAHGIDYEAGNLKKIYDRNSKLLEKYSLTCMITSGAQVAPVPHICLTRDGVNGILMRLDYHRIKNEEKKQKILSFLDWSIDTLGKVMDGKIDEIKPLIQKPETSIPVNSIENIVRQNLSIADSLVQFAHVDRGIAVSVALANAEFTTGCDLTVYKNLIRKDRQQPPGLFTPTEIGKQISVNNPKVINQALVQMGFQNKINGEWVLTEIGRNYAEPMPFTKINPTGGSHTGYYLKWSADIIPKVREYLYGIEEMKGKGLLTGYM